MFPKRELGTAPRGLARAELASPGRKSGRCLGMTQLRPGAGLSLRVCSSPRDPLRRRHRHAETLTHADHPGKRGGGTARANAWKATVKRTSEQQPAGGEAARAADGRVSTAHCRRDRGCRRTRSRRDGSLQAPREAECPSEVSVQLEGPTGTRAKVDSSGKTERSQGILTSWKFSARRNKSIFKYERANSFLPGMSLTVSLVLGRWHLTDSSQTAAS